MSKHIKCRVTCRTKKKAPSSPLLSSNSRNILRNVATFISNTSVGFIQVISLSAIIRVGERNMLLILLEKE